MRGVSLRSSAARRRWPARAVPTLRRHLLHPAERDPDVPCRDTGGQGLGGGAVAKLDNDRVAQQHPAERPELLVDSVLELAELHAFILASGPRHTTMPPAGTGGIEDV